MEKEAVTLFELYPVLKRRWSPRAFSDREIEKEKIRRMFEAARWSPSSSNEQPWYFIIGFKGDKTYEGIFQSLVEFNQLWAGTAPLLMVNCGKKTGSGKNAGSPNVSYAYDVGQSVAHFTFQAMSEGVFVHQMGGFSKEILREEFDIPEDYDPLTVLAAGYPGYPEKLHPKLRKLEYAKRERKQFSTFVFHESFGLQTDLFDNK